MAFISSCPKCQKPVLVPEGHGHDAVVQCPACFVEYPLGDILATVPELIVVHPGSAAAQAALAAPTMMAATVAVVASASAAESSLAEPSSMDSLSIFSAHRIEPGLDDSDALDFVSEGVPVGSDGGREVPFTHDAEHVAADALFAAAVAAEDHPSEAAIEPLTEPLAVPEGDGHAPDAADGQPADDWGGNWLGLSDEATHAESDEGAIGLAETETGGEDNLAHVNFAEITGKPAPSTAATGEAVVAFEPPRKKKRKREANPLVRIIGIIVFGLLAVPCALAIAMLCGQKFDFPSWLPFLSKKAPSQSTSIQPPPVKAETSAANVNTTAADETQPGAGANKSVNEAGGSSTQSDSAKSDGEAKPAAAVGASSAHSAPSNNELAVNLQSGTKSKSPSKEDGLEPAAPSASEPEAEPKAPGQPDKTGGAPAEIAPIGMKPKAETPSKPEEADPFATKPQPANPESAKPTAESKLEAPAPVKPESPSKSEAPTKPEEADPFAAKAPAKAEPKPETPALPKPEAASKPEEADPLALKPQATAEPKPETPSLSKPEAPSKPEETDPLAPKPQPTAPESEKKAEPKPESPIPAKPDILMPDKPDTAPKPALITPPTTTVKMAEVKPAVGPLNPPTIAAAAFDAALKTIDSGGSVDAKSYADWCKLAEIATYASGASTAQTQAIRKLAAKVAANPSAVAAIEAQAKKLFDDKATQGGIVLAGKVTVIANKNNLIGMAIHLEGQPKAVMVFSSHPLEVKEGQSVVVLGGLVGDPVKNLPGTSKAPVVVWAEFAVAVP